MISVLCIAIFWVVSASSGEKSCLLFSIPTRSGAGGEGGVSHRPKSSFRFSSFFLNNQFVLINFNFSNWKKGRRPRLPRAEDSEEWCALGTAHDDESFVQTVRFSSGKIGSIRRPVYCFFAEKLSGSTVKIVRNSRFIFVTTINYFWKPK